jgi:phosphoglycolate phosphatase-like HAD superfamily hydrolase
MSESLDLAVNPSSSTNRITFVPPMIPRSGKILITFDIDGTLIRFGGESAKHPLAFIKALNKLTGLDINVYPEAYLGEATDGWTDLQLARALLRKSGLPDSDESLSEFRTEIENTYCNICQKGLTLVPNVHEILNYLSTNPNLILTVATGNFEKIAKKKLELGGIDHFFRWDLGGFGNVMKRADVVRTTLIKCGQMKDIVWAVHIGDTPQDAIAAREIGFASVIVTTGRRTTGFPEYAKVFPEFSLEPNFLSPLGVNV